MTKILLGKMHCVAVVCGTDSVELSDLTHVGAWADGNLRVCQRCIGASAEEPCTAAASDPAYRRRVIPMQQLRGVGIGAERERRRMSKEELLTRGLAIAKKLEVRCYVRVIWQWRPVSACVDC